jgi:hypothetical protein
MSNNCQIIGLLALFGLCGSPAMAQGSSFSMTVGTAVLCLDDLDPGFLYNYMAQLKPSYKREEGAYWFKTATDMFGVPVTEVFISDGSSEHNFVGVLSSLPPDQIVEAIGNGAPTGGVFIKDNPADKYSTYSSAGGSVVAFQGKNGKVYCRRDRLKD